MITLSKENRDSILEYLEHLEKDIEINLKRCFFDSAAKDIQKYRDLKYILDIADF